LVGLKITIDIKITYLIEKNPIKYEEKVVESLNFLG
jgi:hypothetical protein